MAGLWQMVFRQLQPRKKRMVPQNVRLLNRNKPEESGQMHTQEQERTQKDVENEDLLINQIDEFREKAKQLQVLLEAKESKAAELQSLVDERAGKAQELEHILTERQEEADKIVTEFGRKVDANIGIYKLSGSPELLTFLYRTGMGGRRSEGHGMWEIVY